MCVFIFLRLKLRTKMKSTGVLTTCKPENTKTPLPKADFQPQSSSTVMQNDRTSSRITQYDHKASPGFQIKKEVKTKMDPLIVRSDNTENSSAIGYIGNNVNDAEMEKWKPPPCGDSFFADSQLIPNTLADYKSRSAKNSPNTSGILAKSERKLSLDAVQRSKSDILSQQFSITEDGIDSFDNYVASHAGKSSFKLSPPKVQKTSNGSTFSNSNWEEFLNDSSALGFDGSHVI